MRDTLDPSKHDPQGMGTSGYKGFLFAFKIFTPENIWAFLLFLIVVALILFTTDSSPAWIYQGF